MMTTMRKRSGWAEKLKSQMVIDFIFLIHGWYLIFNFNFFIR